MTALVVAHGSAGTEPAGGAAISEAILATGSALVVMAGIALLIWGHRSGRIRALARAAAWSQRVTGLPGWSALPSMIMGASLLIALIGMYWDISLHIDNGRDPGPLANPAHYFILVGLFGAMTAGAISIALPDERPGKAAVRIAGDWYAPLGGLLMFICGAFALSGFPLDDFWHRLFGQDVTLWGPTHLMLIGGAALTTIGGWILFIEGKEAREHKGRTVKLVRYRQVGLAGGFLVGLSTFQAEFDFGVPQFRLLFHPVLIMLAAGMALTAGRMQLGRGGALLVAMSFLVIRGLLELLIGPGLGQSDALFPLYLAEALVVEAVAWRTGTERPLRFGALAGAGIGSAGLAAEWAWSHVAFEVPWPSALLPEAAIAGFVTAVAAGTLGAAIGAALSASDAPRDPYPRFALPAAALAIVAVIAYALPVSAGDPVRAQVTLEDTRSGAEREAIATVRLDPRDAAEDPEWFNVTAWQGEGSKEIDMREVGPGTYRSEEPVPVHGGWKSILRLHRGGAIQGMPIYLPADPAIPAEEVPARASFERDFVLDKENLQREAKSDVPGALVASAYLTVLAIAAGLILSLAWGIARLERVRRKPAAA